MVVVVEDAGAGQRRRRGGGALGRDGQERVAAPDPGWPGAWRAAPGRSRSWSPGRLERWRSRPAVKAIPPRRRGREACSRTAGRRRNSCAAASCAGAATCGEGLGGDAGGVGVVLAVLVEEAAVGGLVRRRGSRGASRVAGRPGPRQADEGLGGEGRGVGVARARGTRGVEVAAEAAVGALLVEEVVAGGVRDRARGPAEGDDGEGLADACWSSRRTSAGRCRRSRLVGEAGRRRCSRRLERGDEVLATEVGRVAALGDDGDDELARGPAYVSAVAEVSWAGVAAVRCHVGGEVVGRGVGLVEARAARRRARGSRRWCCRRRRTSRPGSCSGPRAPRGCGRRSQLRRRPGPRSHPARGPRAVRPAARTGPLASGRPWRAWPSGLAVVGGFVVAVLSSTDRRGGRASVVVVAVAGCRGGRLARRGRSRSVAGGRRRAGGLARAGGRPRARCARGGDGGGLGRAGERRAGQDQGDSQGQGEGSSRTGAAKGAVHGASQCERCRDGCTGTRTEKTPGVATATSGGGRTWCPGSAPRTSTEMEPLRAPRQSGFRLGGRLTAAGQRRILTGFPWVCVVVSPEGDVGHTTPRRGRPPPGARALRHGPLDCAPQAPNRPSPGSLRKNGHHAAYRLGVAH